MASTTLNSRLLVCTKTTAQWAESSNANLVPMKGEICIEMTTSGIPKFKVGDGTNKWSDLPYATLTPTEIANLISSTAYELPKATSTTLGGVIVGTNIDVGTDGKISIKDGTTGQKGVVKLSDSTTSTSSDTAATSKAVASAMAKADQGVTDAATAKGIADQAKETAEAAMPKSGGTFTGAVTLHANPTTDLGAATKQYVDTQISTKIAASDAMVFKGTVGTGGDVTALPTSNVVIGDTYKVFKAGTYAGQAAKVGDLFIALKSGSVGNSDWSYIPAGNESETFLKYSTTTSDLTTTAKSGTITLGEASIKQIDSSISAGSTSTNLPTSAAVATFVEGKGYKTTDENVKQTSSTANGAYPLLASANTSPTSGSAQKAIYNTGITINPSTKTITATNFAGKASSAGTADSATTAATATKLKTAVSFSITGKGSAAAVDFDGSSNVALNMTSFNANGLVQTAGDVIILDGNFS